MYLISESTGTELGNTEKVNIFPHFAIDFSMMLYFGYFSWNIKLGPKSVAMLSGFISRLKNKRYMIIGIKKNV